MAAKRAERVVLQGHSVIVDGVFARESERSKINEIANVGSFERASTAGVLTRLLPSALNCIIRRLISRDDGAT